MRGELTWDELLRELERKREAAEKALEGLRSTAYKRDITEAESKMKCTA